MPGAPGLGAGALASLLRIPAAILAQAFLSGAAQVANAKRPPDLRTRWTSHKHVSGSGINMIPKRIVTASNDPSGKSSASPSTRRNSTLFTPARRSEEHTSELQSQSNL